ncbi:2-phospho-L-lactate transferase [Halonotius aquaticus]|uniref:2-phospho-L-lactate transferase n=1 Tax=Halonotius aquaticus TaxID=2216978 RepID=A0A3A6PMU2_9EURY|nr:2-phospho-L-lactate transferase [Halonotius aquaticus]RJX42830.1 2-phospho-L-lactate transferase [Halonotius aquaticus]
MRTLLAGGTGTPKLLAGAKAHVDPAELTVVGNTGDDVELGGLLVCPDLDTVLFHEGGMLDTDRWWGIDGDSHETTAELHRLADAAGLDDGPQFLPDDKQTTGREIARWRRFSGIAEFMTIGDRDRAVHITRTSLLDEGHSLTETTAILADAFGVEVTLLPMSDDPVASLIHTDSGLMHFQAYWVGHRGDVAVNDVEFRGADDAEPTDDVLDALDNPVVIGPSNPVTSIGPMLALDGVEAALDETDVVAVSPFIEDRVFSGPAADLMAATGREPSTQGVADAYPFVDAFVLDTDDETELDRPVVRTDTAIETVADSERVFAAIQEALARV